jgi:hypothetical protein
MIVRWKAIYTLRNRVLVSGTVPNYPQLGVVIRCVEGAIACIEHELSADEQASHDEVLAASQRDLSLLMEWLAYEYGVPIQVQTRTTERIADDPAVPALKTGSTELDLKCELVRSVTLPSEMRLLGARPRLQGLLRYANDARDSKTAEEAVRLYYVILEDLFEELKKGKWPMDALKIKYCRDFTSHGDELKNGDLLAYLEEALGKGTCRFDPLNQSHRTFVRTHRMRARTLIESELKKYLM